MTRTNGEVFDNGRLVDTLRVVDFPRPYRFNKEGQGLLAPVDPTVDPTEAKNFEVAGGARPFALRFANLAVHVAKICAAAPAHNWAESHACVSVAH